MVTISQRCPMISPVLWKAHKLKLWIIWKKSLTAWADERIGGRFKQEQKKGRKKKETPAAGDDIHSVSVSSS